MRPNNVSCACTHTTLQDLLLNKTLSKSVFIHTPCVQKVLFSSFRSASGAPCLSSGASRIHRCRKASRSAVHESTATPSSTTSHHMPSSPRINLSSPLVPARRATWPNGEWGYSTRCHMQGPERPEAVLPDRALYLPTLSNLLIVNKLLSLARARSTSPLLLPQPLTGRRTSQETGGSGGHYQQSSGRRGHVPLSPCLPRL